MSQLALNCRIKIGVNCVDDASNLIFGKRISRRLVCAVFLLRRSQHDPSGMNRKRAPKDRD